MLRSASRLIPRSRCSLPLAHRRPLSSSSSSSSVVALTDETAPDFMSDKHDKAVVYFTATWCAPCRAIKPLYNELSLQYDEISFGKVDVDECVNAAAANKISSIPKFHFLKAGKVVKTVTGSDSTLLEDALSWLDEEK